MRTLTRLALTCALTGFALPAQAQNGDISIAYFVTTDLANVLQLEEGMRGHVGWHAQQNDPWPGYVYQAMTGGPEYVWISPAHMWADFDNPPVDPHADMTDFVQRAGTRVTSLDIRFWRTWSDVSIPPAPDAVIPIWEVIEWDVNATSEGTQALRAAFGKVKAALEQQEGVHYTVDEVVSANAAPHMFVAIAHQSMAELDGGEPNGLEMLLEQAYGRADAMQIMHTFETYLIPTASRLWMLRQDLSHIPGM